MSTDTQRIFESVRETAVTIILKATSSIYVGIFGSVGVKDPYVLVHCGYGYGYGLRLRLRLMLGYGHGGLRLRLRPQLQLHLSYESAHWILIAAAYLLPLRLECTALHSP